MSDGRITCVLLVSVAIAVIGGSFQYGYNISVVNAPAKIIQEYFFEGEPCDVNETSIVPQNNATDYTSSYTNDSFKTTCEIVLTPAELLIWSVTVSIYTVGGMVGAFMTGILVGIFGRKYGLLAMNFLSISGAIMMACSKPADSIALLIIPRFMLGVYAGLATGVVPMYIGEISPKQYRGAVMALNQLLITVGLLAGQVLSLTEIIGTPELWNLLLAFTCVPSLIELAVLPFCPESPRCLLIDKKDEDAARDAQSDRDNIACYSTKKTAWNERCRGRNRRNEKRSEWRFCGISDVGLANTPGPDLTLANLHGVRHSNWSAADRD